MSIFSLLNTNDKNMMYDYIYNYGSRSNCVQAVAPLEKILSYWTEAKSEYLFDIMGGNLILSKKVSYQKSTEEVENTIRSKITYSYDSDNKCKEFLKAWYALQDLLSARFDDNEIHWAMSELVGSSTLASNRYTYNTVEIPLPNDKKYRLLQGAKASKAIGKIAIAYNLPNYEEFRIAHSQALNEKSLTGEMCMSIHPMDYMTMSDNDCGWGSCMSWNDHGDFRQGTVEMMNSPMVVVVYLKSSTDYCVPGGYTWNSKRWRELFIITRDVISGIKGYPYWNKELEEIALHWIKEVVMNSGVPGFGPYRDDIVEYNGHDSVVMIHDDPEDESFGFDIPLRFETKLMYNDFYDSHRMFIAEDSSRVPDHIHYSGISECMSCGDELRDWETESDLFCGSCDPVYRCCECGDWHSIDDLIEVDGDYYCEYCYDQVISNCADCGQPHYYENMIDIHLAKDDEHIFVEKEILMDDDCIWGGNFFHRDDLHYQRGRWGSRINYVNISDLTEDGMRAFGFHTAEEMNEYDAETYDIGLW